MSSIKMTWSTAWGQFSFNDAVAIRGGVVLPPVGRYNILHDDDYWDLPRRPLSVRGAAVTPTKLAWREVGAGVLINKPLGDGYFDDLRLGDHLKHPLGHRSRCFARREAALECIGGEHDLHCCYPQSPVARATLAVHSALDKSGWMPAVKTLRMAREQ